ncbi:MAG: hypothetical protein AAFS10_00090 [Myxococcota bacterium]
MSNIPLKDAVREHVGKRRLNDTQVEALLALQQKHLGEHGATTPPRPMRSRWPWAMVAALLAIALAVWVALQGPGPAQTHVAEAIAAEVTKNHIKLKPLEVESTELGDVRAFFAELDFVPVRSVVVAAAGLELVGGRYCSIQGEEAAQLRVRNPATGGIRSVYMARYDPERFGPLPTVDTGEKPTTLHARGLEVTLWVEQGVLLAMTGDP